MFKKAKDWGASQAVSAFLRPTIEKYAELKVIEIDSSAKKVRVVIRLKGETEDLELLVDKYELIKENEIHLLVVSQLSCSREWIALLAKDHLVGKRIKIPSVAATLL